MLKTGNGAAKRCGEHDPGDRRAGSLRQVDLHCARPGAVGRPSRRTAAVGLQFGLPLFAAKTTIIESAQVAVGPGRIVLLTGPSGGGKTSALAQIERDFAGGCNVQRVAFHGEAAIVDRIAPWQALPDVLGLMCACGLGEARLWVRPFTALSDGEKFRARLARAVALHARNGAAAPLLCDEFCSMLHRRVARAVSFGLRKLVDRHRLSIVVACCQDDILADLQPDTLVKLPGQGRCEIEDRKVRPGKPFSGRRRLVIGPGGKRDYGAFAAMHYRAGDELGFVDKVFVLRDGAGGDPLGIVVYAHAPLELQLRNEATHGYFSRHAARVNRSLRILRRLVIHPDVRGCGLGHYLVRETLPQVGTQYVECLAGMGEFNPVFEKAGMKRIGQYEMRPSCREAIDTLRDMDVDPAGREFVLQVGRRPRVRRVVTQVVRDWYASTTAGAQSRVDRQSPQLLAQTFRGLIGSRPVYYLWKRPTASRSRGTKTRHARSRNR